MVGITAMGPQIRRAYDLADHFRARGKKVRRYDADALVALLAEHGLTLERSAMSVWSRGEHQIPRLCRVGSHEAAGPGDALVQRRVPSPRTPFTAAPRMDAGPDGCIDGGRVLLVLRRAGDG